MMLPTTVSLAIDALVRNKLRSSLTMLGIVIGVAAVVTMQAMGGGATQYVTEAISGLGSNMLIAVPGATHNVSSMVGVPLFTAADLDTIRRRAPDVDRLTAVNSRQMRVIAGSNNHVTGVIGAMPDYFAIRNWGTSRGRLLASEDERQSTLNCVIGQTLADQLFPGADPIHAEIRIHDLPCRVIGILEAKGGSMFGTDQDDIAILPYSTFSRRVLGNTRVATIMASAPTADRIDAAKGQLLEILRERRHIPKGDSDDFTVRDPRELQALMQRVTAVLTSLLAGVAAISLLVGGIGIMNIMLVSVTERTREIGVRLAVGARSADILLQFLVESMLLASVGGAIGVVFGLAAARGIAAGIHIPFVMPLAAIPPAISISILVGVVFGVFPARKAAGLNPLAALRTE
jgi:putative ABC transport system permease protein